MEAWPECRIAPYFDAFLCSSAVGLMKPDLEIYREGCRRLGTDPDECLFIGDGGSDELRGAKQAGMTPLWASSLNSSIS